ncbi:MAG: hypothetical protein WD739_07445 [Actinomycetota bacterium]
MATEGHDVPMAAEDSGASPIRPQTVLERYEQAVRALAPRGVPAHDPTVIRSSAKRILAEDLAKELEPELAALDRAFRATAREAGYELIGNDERIPDQLQRAARSFYGEEVTKASAAREEVARMFAPREKEASKQLRKLELLLEILDPQAQRDEQINL